MTLMPTDDNLEPEQNKGKQAKNGEEVKCICCFKIPKLKHKRKVCL